MSGNKNARRTLPDDADAPVGVRALPQGLEYLAQALTVAILSISLGFIFNVPSQLGYAVQREQFLAAFLGCVTCLTFLRYPPAASLAESRSFLFVDATVGLLALAAFAYVMMTFQTLAVILYTLPPLVVALSAFGLLVLLEAARRAAGASLTIIGTAFILYSFFSDWMPGDLYNATVPFDRLVTYLFIDTNAVLGLPVAIAMGVVLPFVLFGSVLAATGGTALYTDLAASLMGRFRGGAGKVAVIASALFGSISGSAVSNVVSTGVITIPMMRRAGFRRVEAGAIEAVASTGGQIMPPIMGATAFLMAEFLNVPYSTVALAGLVPALLFFFAVFVSIHLIAIRNNYAAIPRDQIKMLSVVLRTQGLFLLPLIVIIACLFGLDMQPEDSAIAGVVASVVAYFLSRNTDLGLLFRAVLRAGQLVVQISVITAVAGIIIGVLNITGLGFALTIILTNLAGNSLPVMLLLVALVSMVLGLGLPSTGIYLILAVLVGPALEELGVDRLAAHMYIFYFGILSFITPPVCFAAFAAATISGAGPMRTGFEAMRIALASYALPFLFVYTPALLGQGDPWVTVAGGILAAVAIVFLAIASIGCFTAPVGPVARAGAVVVAVILAVILALAPKGLLFAATAVAVVLTLLLYWQGSRAAASAPSG